MGHMASVPPERALTFNVIPCIVTAGSNCHLNRGDLRNIMLDCFRDHSVVRAGVGVEVMAR